MATPISFRNHEGLLPVFGGAVYKPYETERIRGRKVSANFSSKHNRAMYWALANVSGNAEFEVLHTLCQNIAGLEFKRRKTGGIDIYPRISWEQSWSELSFYLQLAGDIPACEDAFTRLKVMGYRPNAWKKAVSENLSKIIYINDSVIGNATYYNQTLKRINASMNDLYETLNLVDPNDAT